MTRGAVAVVLGLTLVCHGTAGADQTAQILYKLLHRSVVMLIAVSADNEVLHTGSGVVIRDGMTILTNHHVIDGAPTLLVHMGDDVPPVVATVRECAPDADLATVSFNPPMPLPAVSLATSLPEVGAAVVAIGSPMGLAGTLSTGIVSQVRQIGGLVMVQNTTPISPGSSGGGLFDAAGSLIGVTTGALEGGQQLNFASSVNNLHLLAPCEITPVLAPEPVAVPEPAPDYEDDLESVVHYARVTADVLNVRSGPGIRNKVVAKLHQGAVVEIRGGPETADKSMWYLVRGSRCEGWVHAAHLDLDPSDGYEGPKARFATVRVTSDTLNLRSGPGTRYKVLTNLKDGTEVEVLAGPEVHQGGLWYRVRAQGRSGWVHGDYLNMPEPQGYVETSSESPTPAQMAKYLDVIADQIFHARHPELNGRAIRAEESHLAREWKEIRYGSPIVDFIFYQLHPELGGRRLSPEEHELVTEWKAIEASLREIDRVASAR